MQTRSIHRSGFRLAATMLWAQDCSVAHLRTASSLQLCDRKASH